VIPRGYPELPVRTKIGLAPLVALVFALYALGQAGVINLHLDAGQQPGPRGASAAPLPSRAARAEIPATYLALYRSAATTCPGLPWGVLAGIGKVETDHGRSHAPGVRSGVNTFGCCAGPMQFNIRNGPPLHLGHLRGRRQRLRPRRRDPRSRKAAVCQRRPRRPARRGLRLQPRLVVRRPGPLPRPPLPGREVIPIDFISQNAPLLCVAFVVLCAIVGAARPER
jgi:hypothetical protein